MLWRCIGRVPNGLDMYCLGGRFGPRQSIYFPKAILQKAVDMAVDMAGSLAYRPLSSPGVIFVTVLSTFIDVVDYVEVSPGTVVPLFIFTSSPCCILLRRRRRRPMRLLVDKFSCHVSACLSLSISSTISCTYSFACRRRLLVWKRYATSCCTPSSWQFVLGE